MKETEEILHKILGEDLVYWPHNVLTICEKYHQERLKSSLPSEEEIENLSEERFGTCNAECYGFKEGFKKCLQLLAKRYR